MTSRYDSTLEIAFPFAPRFMSQMLLVTNIEHQSYPWSLQKCNLHIVIRKITRNNANALFLKLNEEEDTEM